ncbi:hypothetical protein [Verrucomicrobium spinosum]|uniref:hypothetical protein n=1 Tax=Verrucomicrobium spinosum TaxID=2736 RepID=UPI00094645E4|nr:hypothetical protein [Verrucomicrobium spinosum]
MGFLGKKTPAEDAALGVEHNPWRKFECGKLDALLVGFELDGEELSRPKAEAGGSVMTGG